MRVLRPGALLGAFLIASPTIYAAFVTGTASVDAAIVRFLIAVVPCGIALGLLDGLALAQSLTEGAVAGQLGRACRDQVAEPRQAGERDGVRPETIVTYVHQGQGGTR